MLSKKRQKKLCANPKYNQAKVLIEYVVSVCVSTKLGLFFALLFAHPFSLSHFLPRRSDQNLWACLWMTSLRKIVYDFSEKLWFLEIYLFCSFALYLSRLFLFFLLNCSNQKRFISTFRYHNDTNSLYRFCYFILVNGGIYFWLPVSFIGRRFTRNPSSISHKCDNVPVIGSKYKTWFIFKQTCFFRLHFVIQNGYSVYRELHRVATRFEAFERSSQ